MNSLRIGYQDICGKIQAVSDSFVSANIFIIGDLKNPSLFSPFLSTFIKDCHLIPSDTLLLPSDAFTYASDAHGSRRWLDHVLSHSSICDTEVKYNCVSSDHLPLVYHMCQVITFFRGPHPGVNLATLSCVECCHPQDLHNYHT